MSRWRLDLAVLALLLPVSVPGHADEPRTAPDFDRLLALSMDALTQVQVSTASIRPATPREQPGAVTLITAQDMAAAGCRTLQDALRLVPGVSSGIDVFNVTGLIFRGTWAYEGKILFLVDDMPVNDLLFGTYAIPPDFPVDILDRVEVLRGPGGAKYGENAELAVIRIYTRNSAQKGGFANFTMATQGAGTPLRQFSTGQHWQGQQGALALLGTVSSSNWGNGQWTDAVGTPYDTSQQHQQSAQYAMDATWLGSRLKVYGEQFTMAAPERYGIVTPDQVIAFQHTNVRLDHAFDVGAGVELTPRWSYRQEDAWHGTSLSLPSYYEPLGQWGFALFYAYAVLGFLALAYYLNYLAKLRLRSGRDPANPTPLPPSPRRASRRQPAPRRRRNPPALPSRPAWPPPRAARSPR